VRVGGVSSPTPEPSYSNDPFNPDVTIWPEAPGWLFPAVMTAFVIVALVVLILIIMWRRSVVYERREREAKGPTQWVDLSKLDRKGRWEEDSPALERDADPDAPTDAPPAKDGD
jgi:hypothetical protein